ncbi:hypothetical protein PCANC_08703 [Puccinia coronata f. sp. avenae]|uniref:Uncharacterized protein n=1 Tax=Puccinia coronata f. sp. avenae TaxID=200324 RepID=A0A2N5VSC1_9BASI|nr:hypothetical protein PCANC_08703 [Puccinia coronata f. sp. avenae]
MDPWSSNDAWVDSAEPISTSSSSTLEPELPLPTSHTPQPAWPLPDLSLPNWDNPSPQKLSPPLTASHSMDALPQSSASQTQPEVEPVSLPIDNLTINTHISSPASSSQSVFKTPDSSRSEKWVQSSQSPVDEPTNSLSDSGHMTSSAPPAHLSHPTQPEPSADPDPDGDRWGTFTHIDLPAIPSVPVPTPPILVDTPPIQSGWDGETHLGGWDDGLAVDRPLPPLRSSISIPELDDSYAHQDDPDRAWSPPHFSDPADSDHADDPSGDAWGQSNLGHPDGSSSDEVDQQNMAHEQDNHDQYPEEKEEHLPSSNAGIHHSAAASGAELASATADAFQTAMSKTAQAATSVMKSANHSRSFFSNNARTQSSLSDSIRASNSSNPTNNTAWGDLANLDESNSRKTNPEPEQQEQKRRTGFFGFWSSKSTPTANTPASPPDLKMRAGSSTLLPLEVTRDAASFSLGTPSTAGLALSPASPNHAPPPPPAADPAASAISRLFGRLGSRSNHASISTSALDDQYDISAPSTELNANEINFLDNIKTVPIEPKTVRYDDFSSFKSVNSSSLTAKPQSSESESGLFDFLSDPSASPNLVSPFGSQRPTCSPNRPDPFEFLDSLSRGGPAHQKRGLSDQTVLSARISSTSLRSAAGKKASSDDLDELFSHFQGAELPTRTHIKSSAAKPPNPAAFRDFQKPLSTKSIPPPGATQVRMASTTAKLADPRDSPSVSASYSSSRVPILAPPPSSSRPAAPSGPIPLIPPPKTMRPAKNQPHPSFSSPAAPAVISYRPPPPQNTSALNLSFPPSNPLPRPLNTPSSPHPPPSRSLLYLLNLILKPAACRKKTSASLIL